MKVTVTLSNGRTCDLVGIDDVDVWMKSFAGRGTSQLGDWLEVVPDDGTVRTFVRASAVVSVQLLEEEGTARP